MDVNSKLFGSRDAVTAQFFDAMDRVLTIFDKYISKVGQMEDARNHGCFKYVALNEKKFLAQMYNVFRVLDILGCRKSARFLDVGCGIGTKVFLSSALFSRADGIEFDKNYFEVAQKIFLSSSRALTRNISFMQEDAMRFSNYKDYEVIYLYRPFQQSDKQNELEAKIALEARENTVIVGTLCSFYNLPEQIRPIMVFSNGYLKSDDQNLLARVKGSISEEQ